MLATLSLAIIALTLLFTAWQTWELNRQSRTQLEVALSTAGDAPLAMLHQCLAHLVEHPELRPCFYDGRVPTAEDRQRTLAIAELLADAVNQGIDVTEAMPRALVTNDGWRPYASFLLHNSPTLDGLVEEHSDWWRSLAEVRRELAAKREAPAHDDPTGAQGDSDDPQKVDTSSTNG